MRYKRSIVALAFLGSVLVASSGAALAPGGAVPAHVSDGAEGAEAQPVLDWTRNLAPGEICGTQQQYLAEIAALGGDPLAALCPPNGMCDEPDIRDAFIPGVETPMVTIRLIFHVFCLNNGQDCAVTQNDVDLSVDRLNDQFAPYGFQFEYQTEFVQDTRYRFLDSSETAGMKRRYATAPESMLNIYVVETAGFSWGTFPWSAWATTDQGGIVMHQDAVREGYPLKAILAHEVGHCLGLWHTFHGMDEVELCSDCYEAAGRSPVEGDVTGDYCSDTNATPKNLNNCADPLGLDPCSGLPWTDAPYTNIMGYSHICAAEFTPQQAGRMHCWTTDVLSGWIQLPAPPDAPGSPSLAKLGGGVIGVSWSDNSGDENGFEVQRARKNGNQWVETTIIADVGANVTSIVDAPGSGTFRYQVRAYNDNGDSNWSSWTQIKN